MKQGRLLVLLTCLVAALAYSGAVTTPALVTLVVPECLVVGLLALLISRLALGLLAVFVSAGAIGEVINVVSGDYQGSVARSAFGAGLLTGAAVLTSGTRRPATFLVPLTGLIAWALALGSGGRVALLAVLASVLAVVALAAVERDARRYVTAPRLAPTVLLALLLAAAAGFVALRVQLTGDARQPAAPFRSSVVTTVEPPGFLALNEHPRRRTQPNRAPTPSVATAVAAERRAEARSRQVAFVVVAVFSVIVLGLVVGLLLRWIWVACAWGLLRRRLARRSSPPEAGAWAWVVAVGHRLGEPLPVSASPDVVLQNSRWASLQVLAAQVSRVVFGPAGSPGDVDAWQQARTVADEAWAAADRARRLRARFRCPPRRDRSLQ